MRMILTPNLSKQLHQILDFNNLLQGQGLMTNPRFNNLQEELLLPLFKDPHHPPQQEGPLLPLQQQQDDLLPHHQNSQEDLLNSLNSLGGLPSSLNGPNDLTNNLEDLPNSPNNLGDLPNSRIRQKDLMKLHVFQISPFSLSENNCKAQKMQ